MSVVRSQWPIVCLNVFHHDSCYDHTLYIQNNNQLTTDNDLLTNSMNKQTHKTAPFGTWKSPITSDLIVSGSIGLSQVMLDGDDIYWIESRPAEKGRCVIVRRTPDHKTEDITPAPFNVRTRVHEYGGGAYVVEDGVIYFSNFADNRIYRQELGCEPEPLTPEMKNVRYADFIIDRFHNSLICVCEDHRVTQYEAINSLVSINLKTGVSQTLVSGADFVASPRLSPDGNHLAWIQWNHPNMPWDESELMLGDWEFGGTTVIPRRIAGGAQDVARELEVLVVVFDDQDGFHGHVSGSLPRLGLARQREGEGRALAEGAHDAQGAAVQLDEAARELAAEGADCTDKEAVDSRKNSRC